jgi:hypothetical protein
MILKTRLIPIDSQSRPHLPKSIELDMGDPRGHWEGDTLVVETTNFRSRGIYRNANPDTLRFTERFTRTAADKVRWSVTVRIEDVDEALDLLAALTMNDNEPIMLYGVPQGNYGLRNILSAARAEDQVK